MTVFKKLFVIASTGFLALAVAAEAKAVTLTYDRSIGTPGFATGELFVPQGIGVQDSTGNVFVSNGRGLNPDGSFNPNVGNNINVYDSQGNYLRSVSSGRQEKGEGLDQPVDLKFDPNTGLMHVGDVFNSEIDVYEPNTGEYIRSYGSFGGQVPGRLFSGPGGMSFSPDGSNIYISDFSQDVIKIYDSQTGDLVNTFGSSGTGLGQFQGPAGLSVSPNTGRVYVGDQYNDRIQVLDPEGNSLFSFGSPGSNLGQFEQPIGVEVDEFDNIYVADSQNSRVQVFDREGNFLTAFGEPARTPEGEIVPPPGMGGSLVADPLDLSPGAFNWTGGAHYDRGQLYVGDFFQGRVQVLNVEQDAIGASVPEPSSTLSFLALGTLGAGAWWKRKRSQA
jgi:DNA-binding beta-propeller fold protein YncE